MKFTFLRCRGFIVYLDGIKGFVPASTPFGLFVSALGPTVVCWSPTTNNGEEFTLSHQPTRLWLRGYFIRQRRRKTVTISQQDLLLLVMVVFSFSIPYYFWFIPLSECGIFSVCKNGRWIKLSIYRNRGITAWVLEFNFGLSVWMWTG